VLGFVPVDDHVGRAAVASVVEEHPVTRCGNPLGKRAHRVARPAPAGRERYPRSPAAKDFVMDRSAAYCRVWHGIPPGCDSARIMRVTGRGCQKPGFFWVGPKQVVDLQRFRGWKSLLKHLRVAV